MGSRTPTPPDSSRSKATPPRVANRRGKGKVPFNCRLPPAAGAAKTADGTNGDSHEYLQRLNQRSSPNVQPISAVRTGLRRLMIIHERARRLRGIALMILG